ncbi:MAG: preprotein translocase subunit SecG [Bacteroidaceae bacterium]|nr:preprotein translocase subunit SecG [Bacteroidaceae bacterium]
MFILIIVLAILASVLMCGVVLIQESKGGGLASSFSSSNQVLGVRKTTDVLEKATWGLAIAMAVFCIASAAFVTKNTIEETPINITSPAQQQTGADNIQSFPAANQPAENGNK